MRTPHSLSSTGQILPRYQYLALLQAAIRASEFRFAREAALTWLAAFPGDLEAGLLYAEALMGENHPRQALTILEGLCQVDPEFLSAQELQLAARRACELPVVPDTLTSVAALGGQLAGQKTIADSPISFSPLAGENVSRDTIAAWGRLLYQARQAIQQNAYDQAEQLVRQILAADPPTPLVAVTHLQVLEAAGQAPLQARRSLAELYHRRWPDCLPCTLLLADWLMQSGESEQAVTLLHEVSARDIGGQIARRLWGQNHPYAALWPENLEAAVKIAIPAAVAASLGWNQLPAGGGGPDDTGGKSVEIAASGRPDPASPDPSEPLATEPEPDPAGSGPTPAGAVIQEKAFQECQPVTEGPVLDQPAPDGIPVLMVREIEPGTSPAPAESLRSVQDELERLAAQLNHVGVMRQDGRFPIYVIFSVRSKLAALYGQQALESLEAELKQLVETCRSRPGWGAMLFLADDPAFTAPFGIKPARPGDPWGLKLALVDLDAALAKRGEMIGAVLIVGGPEIVPFHHLPNPVDDDDLDVASDNPYATRDENYFIPEWPVGRLPGGAGNDPGLLIKTLRRIHTQHAAPARPANWYALLWEKLTSWLRPSRPGGRRSFGYTAAVWRQASLSVFRPIGEPRSMLVSPPWGVNGSAGHVPSGKLTEIPTPIPFAKLGYFNLHGLADAAEWYGQRDPADRQEGPDYPVALRPQDVGTVDYQKDSCGPQVVFSEACYGGHILGKPFDKTMALSFLAAGTQAIAGSTSMAYGSVSTPLIAADLLGHSFWNYLRDGLAAGEALRRAKIHLAREMHDRQGYLDGEDQKTLISFVLYGDPLAQPLGRAHRPKAIVRSLKPPAPIKTICDRVSEPGNGQAVPGEVLTYVKHVVAQYLPGMEDAQLTYSHERAECHATGHLCPTGQIKARAPINHPPQRQLVTLSKQVRLAGHTHPHYARLTLDGQGKLVKLVISR